METIIIKDEQSKRYAKQLIDDMPLDGSNTVITKKTDLSPTARQQGLEWKWYTETAASGIGQDDDKDAVHIRAKWQFARPLLLEHDDIFPAVYEGFMKTVKDSLNFAECCRIFARDYIHTSLLPKRLKAKYLTDFQFFWTGMGVNLTDPALRGVDLGKF